MPISVDLFFDRKTRRVCPKSVIWDGKEYLISQLGLHHTFRVGRVLHHVFSCFGEGVFFRLVLDTENLSWTLEEISDGEVD